MTSRLPTLLAGIAFLAQAVCAGVAFAAESESIEIDPWEGFNRKVFAFNEQLDRFVLKPVAKGYQIVTPNFVDTGITNFFGNIAEVPSILNHLLQGRRAEAGDDSRRFIVNTTLGVFGLFDVATKLGIENPRTDLGVTLGRWGLGAGPYLVLPLLGPSTLRDAAGVGGDVFLNPLFYVEDDTVQWSLRGLEIVDTRADLLRVESLISGDRYVFLRETYLQRRTFLITGEVAEDDFGDEDF